MTEGFLSGRTALVTGSVQGIGLSIACALASQGVRVGLHGLADAAAIDTALRAASDAGAPEVRFFAGDLRDPGAIDAMMDAVGDWGAADIVVNNAGVQRVAALAAVTRSLWDDVIGVNLSAAYQTMHRALPVMAERRYGRVINIASVHGLVGSIDKAPYVASKFGLVGLSKAAALEYAAVGSRDSGGVTVNCLCPGWTETPLLGPQLDARATALGGSRDDAVASLLAEKQPSRRVSQPADIASLAVWLCGRSAHNVTGTALPVDGGWTAQ